MVRDVPPFGNYDDSDIERVLNWFLGFLDSADWDDRVAHIEEVIESVLKTSSITSKVSGTQTNICC